MVSTHSLGFLLAPAAPAVLGALYFLWVLVSQWTHCCLVHLEPPGNIQIKAVRMETHAQILVTSRNK